MIAPLRRRTVVFAGGGTGGHLFPAVAVARALPSVEPLFLVPDDRGDVERLGGEFRSVEFRSPRLDRSRALYAPRLCSAVWRARKLLRKEKACAVVGLGSYSSVPACIAARTLGLPVYLMAFDAVPGKATRLLAPMAHGIGVGSELAVGRLPNAGRCKVTGTPLRADLARSARRGAFDLDPALPTLLVFGGSQGARTLNRRVIAGLAACPHLDFQVLHATGVEDETSVREAYQRMNRPASVHAFLKDMGAAYAAADLVLCRGGASSVAECLALGKPAVFVPYPWHRDRQQEQNARAAASAGAARIVNEDHLEPTRFRALIEELLLSDESRKAMALRSERMGRPQAHAARRMAAHLAECIGEALQEPVWTEELGG